MNSLDFTLSLIDKFTRPLRAAQNSAVQFADKSVQAFKRIGIGGAALYGVGQSIGGMLAPAFDMFNALQEQSARGIDSGVLKTVQRDALAFSTTYGTVATDFVSSTAEINSAIAGLTGQELPKVTKVANLMAFEMQSSTAETAEFMRQMFANFRTDADSLGKVQFAEQLAGKMTLMRQRFGLEMGMVKDLMEGARGAGTNYGVGMNEQLAVMGELSRTLGTEASSAYEGFMTSAIEGGKKLGLSFTDTAGKMLSMPDILTKLQGKYGQSLEGNLKAQKELDDAFGDSSAVVKQLYGNVSVLQRNITELGGADGLKRTQEAAAKLVKPMDRFMAIIRAIQIAIGLTLVPALNPLLDWAARTGQTFARWMSLFPNIARVVGWVAMAVLGFAAVGAILNIIMGLSAFILTGWGAALKLVSGALTVVRTAAMLTGAAINFMSWPVLLVIGAIALLVAGCYLLVKHWDTVKAAVMDTAAFQAVAQAVSWLANLFASVWEYISAGWNSFIALLTGFSPLDALSGMASGIMKLFDGIWQAIKKSFSASWNWIVDKLNMIPGVNISTTTTTPPVTENKLSTGGQLHSVEPGGISRTINNSNNNKVDKRGNSIGTVNIYPQEPFTPGKLQEWQEMGL
ncbi:phage tail tape measure protein [Klebsiella pneumoniae]|uniref:phage tail tape measure protein n=1 Tax=Klebsiella pneumoniae TaxID=573 RepID=UPI0013EFE9BC|nr:phage tail tape measure protein [Klebsiella pneumoniae]MCW7024905.1 phage tail tape measure protein [Escherichia coli]HDG7985025.1 phage tail tape measure protein [Klebsiella quasipneumoniae]HDU5255551.1 phage tail tape measure protein [Klebsiella pneumoniae subsp. pneumoniae]NPH39919.1 phage tail tape measure protein [Escherichia coli]QIH90154.1 phage tail tape measure protein [Klebsiella pneumoniae]